MTPPIFRRAGVLALLILAGGCAQPAPKSSSTPPATTAQTPIMTTDDPYLWLEDIHGKKPLESRNAQTAKAYAGTPAFETMRTRILEVLDSDAKIPFVQKLGAHYYNFWKDKAHPRGLWRRTTLDEYRKDAPASVV